MPYIKKERRHELNVKKSVDSPHSCGELNYVLAKEIDSYLIEKGLNYSNINEVIGVLECLKLELYRRIAAPYEDKKILENGDVFDL